MSDPIVVERVIAAPPSVVYEYLTEPDKWARWQGVGVDLEPRPGGALAIAMPNGATASGRFVELVPDRRVVFTWGWAGHTELPPGSSTVEIELRVGLGDPSPADSPRAPRRRGAPAHRGLGSLPDSAEARRGRRRPRTRLRTLRFEMGSLPLIGFGAIAGGVVLLWGVRRVWQDDRPGNEPG